MYPRNKCPECKGEKSTRAKMCLPCSKQRKKYEMVVRMDNQPKMTERQKRWKKLGYQVLDSDDSWLNV